MRGVELAFEIQLMSMQVTKPTGTHVHGIVFRDDGKMCNVGRCADVRGDDRIDVLGESEAVYVGVYLRKGWSMIRSRVP